MRKLLILTILIFSSCIFLHAQTDPSSRCPSISVDGPTGIVAPGEIATFSARITNVDGLMDLKYTWSSSAGEIIRGQGTTTISVRQPTLEITVTVEIKGLPDGCPNLTSEAENWGDRPPQALKLGETSDLRSISAGALLEGVVQVIKDNPNAQLFILSGHISGKASVDVSTKEQELLRDLSDKGVDKNQISVTGVLAELELFQFWLVPPGADPPRCKECEELERVANEARCPPISVDGPAGIIPSGNIAKFTGTVTGDLPTNITYSWTISDGEIVSGQNDTSLEVRIPKDFCGSMTATLDVRGLPRGCPNTASAMYEYAIDPGPLLIDQYGSVSLRQEYAHFRTAAVQLRKNPNSMLFLIQYPTRSDSSIKKRNKLIKNYLTKVLHIGGMFKLVIGPNTGVERTKIYIVPPGSLGDPQP